MHLFHATIARARALGEYIRSHRATSGLFVLSLVIGLFWAGSAHAAVIGDQSGIFNQMLSLITHIMLALARICISLTLFGLKFFIELAKYNDFIDAPPVIIGWVMIRDIANMSFIIVLLVIAFGTILGLDQYEWKKALAKLVVAAILLNFSKLIAQLMIDVAHVVTMTFLNAISATAGGNLINLFHLQGMMSLLASDPSTLAGDDIRLDIFMASVLALVFAAMAMMTIGAYVVVMVFRVVILWILMILAPLAYIMSVVPQTQGYASEYWSKFTKHVIVAPIMVFFLWLCFATIGSGNIGTQIGLDLKGEGNVLQSANGAAQSAAANPSTSLLEVSTWENMGSFIIAIAFLVIGIGMVQQLGVEGGGLVGGVVDFGKKVATIATGVAAARYLAPKLAMKAPLIGGEAWQNRYKSVKGALGYKVGQIQGWRNKKAIEFEEDHKKAVQDGKSVSSTAWAKKALAGFIETGGRKAKKAEDWEEAAERQHEINEKEYSTSSTFGGRIKQDVTARLHETEEKSEAKKQQKIDDKIREIRMSAEAYDLATQGRGLDENNKRIKGALNAEEREVYEAALARFEKERGGSIPEGKRRQFAKNAEKDFELISGLEAAETKGRLSSVSVEEQKKRDKAHILHKEGATFQRIIASETRAHGQDLEAEVTEGILKKGYFESDAGHHVEQHNITLGMQVEAIKNAVDTAESKERAHQLAGAPGSIGAALIASQIESDASATALSNTRAGLLSQGRDEAAAEQQREITKAAEDARKKVEAENPGVTKAIKDLESAEEVVTTIAASLARLSKIKDEFETKLNDKATSESERVKIKREINSVESKMAKEEKGLLSAKSAVEKIKTSESGKKISGLEVQITKATEEAIKKMAKGNVQVAASVSDAMKKLKSVLEQKSVGTLNEAVYQKMIGDRQQIPFPEEASRTAIASVMKDFNKMTKEQLLEAFSKRAERISARIMEERQSGGKIKYSGTQEQREDELFTQALGAKLAQVRNIDDLTSTIEPIIGKMAGFFEIMEQANKGAKAGLAMSRGNGERGSVISTLSAAGTAEAGNIRTVLGRVGEKLPGVTDDNKFRGVVTFVKPGRNDSDKVQIERIVKEMEINGGNQLGGMKAEEVLKIIDELRDAWHGGNTEAKRILNEKY